LGIVTSFINKLESLSQLREYTINSLYQEQYLYLLDILDKRIMYMKNIVGEFHGK